MSVLDKPNVRLHWEYYLDYKDWVKKIDTSSVFYITTKGQLSYINKYPFAEKTALDIREVIRPVNGLLTLGSRIKRSSDIGLWKVSVVNKDRITDSSTNISIQ
jgi:hypothetical protein